MSFTSRPCAPWTNSKSEDALIYCVCGFEFCQNHYESTTMVRQISRISPESKFSNLRFRYIPWDILFSGYCFVLYPSIVPRCPFLAEIAHWNPSSLLIILMLEVEDMLITWCGSLAVLLNKLWRTLFKVEKIEDSFEETIKRYGVYLFCIDDLPLWDENP